MVTQTEIDQLLRFLPLFDDPDRVFVERWGGGQETGDGAITTFYPIYPEDVLEFYRLAGQPSWSDYGYNPPKAARMLADEAFPADGEAAWNELVFEAAVHRSALNDGERILIADVENSAMG